MRFIEPFAGIGGIRYGLERAGDFKCVWANEWDKYACRIYRKNYGNEELTEGDIRGIPAEAIPDHDMLTAGFPCQSFSIAGKRKGFQDTRGTMFFEICRIAEIKQPFILLLENVKGLLNHEGGKTFGIILDTLSELGYDCEWQVHNSKNFGVPQNRERVFIIGYRRGKGRRQIFPLGKDDRIFNEENEPNQRPSQARYSRTLRGTEMKADHTFIMQNKRAKSLTPKVRAGDTFILHNKYGGFREKEIREFHEYSPAIRTPRGGGHIPDIYKEGKIRRLTPTECERLQGFPDGWTEGVSDSQRYKCLGNAVTTNVITEIGKGILNAL